ncbi:hypothetical protein CEXT_503051 [Caerostris extrusa]|uniref:Uncharacterized protein n=1 Tax=Caerostris extrusa TaxID=172846 RepID=A0AAV4PF94_CAEEX|nr:hypothetical protein CEXT_503051 [Caerostris extrusa]
MSGLGICKVDCERKVSSGNHEILYWKLNLQAMCRNCSRVEVTRDMARRNSPGRFTLPPPPSPASNAETPLRVFTAIRLQLKTKFRRRETNARFRICKVDGEREKVSSGNHEIFYWKLNLQAMCRNCSRSHTGHGEKKFPGRSPSLQPLAVHAETTLGSSPPSDFNLKQNSEDAREMPGLGICKVDGERKVSSGNHEIFYWKLNLQAMCRNCSRSHTGHVPWPLHPHPHPSNAETTLRVITVIRLQFKTKFRRHERNARSRNMQSGRERKVSSGNHEIFYWKLNLQAMCRNCSRSHTGHGEKKNEGGRKKMRFILFSVDVENFDNEIVNETQAGIAVNREHETVQLMQMYSVEYVI